MKNIEIQVRRKPRQSRARVTQEALMESFVRL
ncbi:MAG: TetR/AcrR family transcriptional regulator, partial [Acinetobacter sp.]